LQVRNNRIDICNEHDGMNRVLAEAVVWDLQSYENGKMIGWRAVGGGEIRSKR